MLKIFFKNMHKERVEEHTTTFIACYRQMIQLWVILIFFFVISFLGCILQSEKNLTDFYFKEKVLYLTSMGSSILKWVY